MQNAGNNKINIILCSCNGEKFISEQLDSILNQTYKNFGILIFDDCSTDSTADIVEEYEERYKGKIELIRRNAPSGSAKNNFFLALRDAPESDYYMLSDQDDVWHENKTEKLLEVISKYSHDVPVLVHSDSNVVNEKLELMNNSFAKFVGLKPERTSFNNLLLENQVVGGSIIINKALKDMITAIPVNAIMHDHWLALCASAKGKIAYVNESLYDYRQHEKNEVGAEKGGFIHKLFNRIGNGETVKRNRKRAVEQAEEFLNVYSSELDRTKIHTLKKFIELDKLPKVKKLNSMIKNDFMYSNWYQTIGEWILL